MVLEVIILISSHYLQHFTGTHKSSKLCRHHILFRFWRNLPLFEYTRYATFISVIWNCPEASRWEREIAPAGTLLGWSSIRILLSGLLHFGLTALPFYFRPTLWIYGLTQDGYIMYFSRAAKCDLGGAVTTAALSQAGCTAQSVLKVGAFTTAWHTQRHDLCMNTFQCLSGHYLEWPKSSLWTEESEELWCWGSLAEPSYDSPSHSIFRDCKRWVPLSEIFWHWPLFRQSPYCNHWDDQ